MQAYNVSTGLDIRSESTKRCRNDKRKNLTDDEVTDDENCSEWIRLRTIGKHRVLKMGDPILCVSGTFTVSRKHFRKFEYNDTLDVGKISGFLLFYISDLFFLLLQLY